LRIEEEPDSARNAEIDWTSNVHLVALLIKQTAFSAMSVAMT
jgi:hypothetical protein